MQKLKINSVVKLYTLSLLNNGPKHGYEIIKELESSMSRNISASHVYPFLKSLEDSKLIECGAVQERDKKKYRLTKNGEEFVETIFSKLGGVIDSVIDKKLTTCTHCQCRIYDGGYVEMLKGQESTFCCPHCAEAYKNTSFSE